MLNIEYKFIRLKITNEENISEKLNKHKDNGWSIVSHSECGSEYSFVLMRSIIRNG